MKSLLIPLIAVLVLCSSSSYPGEEEAQKKASVWMKTKTNLSTKILAGLTDADFDKIRDNAQALNVASLLEVLFKGKDPAYQQQVVLFVTANQELIRQAKAKNLYGATLAFNQLTVSCVQCHQIIRDAKK
jgi:hypothetical protein